MYKIVVILVSFILSLDVLHAKPGSNSSNISVSQVLHNKFAALKSDFSMTKYFDEQHNIRSEGNVIITQDQGICWITQRPVNRLWYITKQGNVLNSYIAHTDVANPMRTENRNNGFGLIVKEFLTILNGNSTLLNESYSSQVEKLEDTDTYQIVLYPKRDEMQQVIKNITLVSRDSFIKSIKIAEKDNSFTLIEFYNQTVLSAEVHEMKDLCIE